MATKRSNQKRFAAPNCVTLTFNQIAKPNAHLIPLECKEKKPVRMWLASVNGLFRSVGTRVLAECRDTSADGATHQNDGHAMANHKQAVFLLRPSSEEKQRLIRSCCCCCFMPSIGGRQTVIGTASSAPRQANGTAADRPRRTAATSDHQCFVMLASKKDHHGTCGRPDDEIASCREDQRVRPMTVPMPGCLCSRRNPSTLLVKRDGERPHSSQNLER